MNNLPNPPVPEIVSRIEEKVNEQNSAVLEDLFLLGYTTSGEKIIYKDDHHEIKAVFRTLLPHEVRDIQEQVGRYSSPIGRAITEQIETLSRSLQYINNMPLILASNERDDFHKRHGRHPTSVEMAHIILTEKIKSEHVLDSLFEAYTEFSNEIFKNFEDLKKKWKTPASSS